ncbi:cytochrome P450 [Desarmillaria tabescens]|uniref:Cytochrome P450 n=1 Tax=Armillaria tabescens TaxID=1929756 RepID=A0AA39U8Y2_ARMTA|nr:cytochrome P450 [Desarmillaria tabescens]KAK0469980.1 cytochrome P450 [Desarmillaria tabescens]
MPSSILQSVDSTVSFKHYILLWITGKDTAWLTLALIAALYYYADDFIRWIKYVAFKCEALRGDNIHGPIQDTRITRFSDGLEMTTYCREKYGSIYRVFCGSIPEIVLTNPEDVRAFYSRDGRAHLKNHNIGFGDYIGKMLGHCVGVKYGKDWSRLRSHIDPHFSSSVAIDLLPIMNADVSEWLNTLPMAMKSPNERTKFKVQAGELVSHLPLKMIASAIFGSLLNDKLRAELIDLFILHERLMTRAILGKFYQWTLASYLPTEANRDAQVFQRDWCNLLRRCAREAEERNIKTAVSELYKTMQEGGMSFVEYCHSVDEILFNNVDVTTIHISWILINLAQHPDVQNRLVQEINTALKDDTHGSRSERTNAYLRRTDSLLHYCYLESGRLHPIAFYSLPQVTAEPKVIGGHPIPAHTSVLIDVYTLGHKSPVWGDDGDAFRPERFASLQPTQYRYSYWGFGIGPRKCVGQHLGDKIVKSVVHQIVERYTVFVEGDVGICRGRFMCTPAATLVLEPKEFGL